MKKIILIIFIIFISLAGIVFLIPKSEIMIEAKKPDYQIGAKITGYNTIPEQTDSTPCYAGDIYICGRLDVIACPRWIPKYSWVEIEGKFYECLDRTALKYDNRFDVSCDKDFECPYRISGWKLVNIYLK